MQALQITRSLAEGGHALIGNLDQVGSELSHSKDDLLSGSSEFDHILADYIGSALEEVSIARYLAENKHAL
eukprot:CAMPEP_0185582640 /NCGR_PEP_ID=MMETSP0434-20130131/21020_1 /TAXON_ID=626734 ORGANISM="Favella taraikaensis, Strain Fe Narragansett Bay" /NCGR_SAMPLE_ID=MMETSP0434 /ASSEMBLY_ACC=CAM_ASM_000379 /LENGTH=70 /DNA_ID=CAMNT_0028201509 /DNA_START=197 /DNA_END=409 /DNA_ORIENTATION=+